MPDRCLLFVLPFSGPLTGGPRTALHVIGTLDRAAFRPVVVHPPNDALASALASLDVETHVVSLGTSVQRPPRARLARRAAQRILALARSRRIEGIWTRSVLGVIWSAPASVLWRRPLVWDIGIEPSSRGLVRLAHAGALAVATRVVTQSRRQPLEIFGPALLRLHEDRFRAITPAVSAARAGELDRARGHHPDRRGPIRTVSCVASIHPRKGQDVLLRAFHRVRGMHPETRLNFIGAVQDRRYFEWLQAMTTELGLYRHVSFLGHREDVPDLLGTTDLLVLASHDEGVPHVVREALWMGVPSVVSAVGGVPELVRHGLDGWLVPPGDPERLAQVLAARLVAHDETRDLGRRARGPARERLCEDRWIREYHGMLEEATV